MVARSKAWVCGLSLDGIAGSNPGGGMDFSLLWVLCVVRWSSLRRGLITGPEESYRVWCVYVWSWILDKEALAHWGYCAKVKKRNLKEKLICVKFWFSLGRNASQMYEIKKQISQKLSQYLPKHNPILFIYITTCFYLLTTQRDDIR